MSTPVEHHAERIRRSIQLTRNNMIRVNDRIAAEADSKVKAKMRERNERRLKALEEMERSLPS